jgi:predicted metal-dependent peptidase|tara:strand:+ start:252 stop:1412 length:1161 start_codon:yes stop_codon:yes gene_type:complete
VEEKYPQVEITPALQKELDKTKIGLMMQGGTFLISVGLMMQHIFTEKVSTAATDGKRIYFNPSFFSSMSRQERIGVLAHEIWHVALMHPIRVEDRDHNVYNQAGDYVINDILHNNGYVLPEPHLYDAKYHGWSTEEVYNDLIDDEDKRSKPNSLGMDIDYSEDSDSETQGDISTSIQDTVMKARAQAKMEGTGKGDIPAEVDRIIDSLINPVLDWAQLLARFMDSNSKNDYTWTRPNRRYFPNHYMPSMFSESIDHLTCSIDTSGSVSQQMLCEILTEIKSIYDTYQPNRMTIIDCDSEIHHVHIVEDSTDILNLKFSGGGGTSFIPVLEYCKKNDTNVLLYFTDLYAESISVDDGYEFDTLWICYSKHDPQEYGETIYYESEHAW